MSNVHIHMVGIGGIGMSALAQLFVSRGSIVRGSDRDASPITDLLIQKGIEVFFGHDATHVHQDTSLLVYSDAVPFDNPERVHARTLGIHEQSYFEALGDVTNTGTSIVVTGTHGKTTTTAMLAKILVDTGHNPTVICGSIMSEYGSNFRLGKEDLFIIEGCEYRRHFLNLHPHVLIVTNIELDHTDYYRDLDDLTQAFTEMVQRVPEQGVVIANTEQFSMRTACIASRARTVAYQTITVPELKVPGTFNEANARAAKAAACAYAPELAETDIDQALAIFAGTWRRFEYKGITAHGALVYDDYAHHPTAISVTLDAARTKFPDKKIVVVFHPHLYSRTRDFMDGFASALAHADEVLLAPIYSAREAPIANVTSEVLADKIQKLGIPACAFISLEDVKNYLLTTSHDLLPTTLIITMGAGDVYRIGEQIIVSP